MHPSTCSFLCIGDLARSIMGGCILNRLGAGKFRSFSAGGQPRGTINRPTLAVCASQTSMSRSFARSSGARTPARRRSSVSSSLSVTTRRKRSVPFGRPAHDRSPGLARSRQGGRNRSRAGACLRRLLPPLYQHISIFASLPFDRLSKLSLHTELDQIGKTRAAATKEPASSRPCGTWPPSRMQCALRVDKDRHPSYV